MPITGGIIMKRLVAIFFLIAAGSTPAIAEWTETGRSVKSISYVDISTIKRQGNFASMETLIDRFESSDMWNPHISSVQSGWFNCTKHSMQHLSVKFYSGHMGQGVLTYQFGADELNYPELNVMPTNGVNILSWKVACGIVVKK
jgi:hypothetical protein